ncbi:MAG: hypothetical protein OEQ74_02310 [Gammaproteobacteria bacterium]|nr:hypothetical protein [Gammaproteobacteria bacterium]
MSLQQKIDALGSADIDQLIAGSSVIGEDQPQSGYQGSVHVVTLDGQRVVIKSVADEKVLRWLRRWMLKNEYLVYQELAGIAGIPQCFGLIDGRHLLLEYIEGTAFRNLVFTQDDEVHARLLALIEQLHSHGVAHADLKRRDNLILSVGREPFLVDFGTAIVRKDGFRPLNHLFFRAAKQLDYHGWFKNKYRNRSLPFDPADEQYYRPMRLERAARWVRRRFRGPLNALREKIASR